MSTKNVKENKVLEFPVEKTKPKLQTMNQSNELATVQKGKWIGVAALSMVLVYSAVNTMVLSGHNKKEQVRSIASTGELEDVNRDIDWEYSLARQLAEKPLQRGIASVGRKPSRADQLIASLLHNKYAVEFKEGKITSIQLPPGTQSHPEYVDAYKLLNENRSVFAVDYQRAKKSNVELQKDKKYESYDLIGPDTKTLGQARLEMDSYGRLLSMKIESETPKSTIKN